MCDLTQLESLNLDMYTNRYEFSKIATFLKKKELRDFFDLTGVVAGVGEEHRIRGCGGS
jgi:hypothetical protein